MYQGPTFAGLLIVVNLPNLPKWHINLPTYQPTLEACGGIARYRDIPYFGQDQYA